MLKNMPKPSIKTLNCEQWESPATAYPISRLGSAEIRRHKYPKGMYEMYGVAGYRFYNIKKPIPVTELCIGGKVWMVDDPPHYLAMREHAACYSGHVVCAGLGLGLIVHTLSQNPRIQSITVIEREQSVIDLIKPLIPECVIIHADFWEDWEENSGLIFDGVFYDLFVGKGRELLSQAMRVWFQLHERFPGTVRRIHGFRNEQLASLDNLIERL